MTTNPTVAIILCQSTSPPMMFGSGCAQAIVQAGSCATTYEIFRPLWPSSTNLGTWCWLCSKTFVDMPPALCVHHLSLCRPHHQSCHRRSGRSDCRMGSQEANTGTLWSQMWKTCERILKAQVLQGGPACVCSTDCKRHTVRQLAVSQRGAQHVATIVSIDAHQVVTRTRTILVDATIRTRRANHNTGSACDACSSL